MPYPRAAELLILADSGGSNGARVRAWKYELRRQVVEPFGLSITVCHDPTGASKWNPLEHRLFGEISKHWAGQPLVSYLTVLRFINQTATQTGLRVRATLVTRRYATRQKISDLQMRKLACQKHRILPDWNYTLSPLENRNSLLLAPLAPGHGKGRSQCTAIRTPSLQACSKHLPRMFLACS